MQSINKKNEKYKYVIIGLLSAFILLNCLICISQALFASLDHDELQHLHIAWNMNNGKILFKDFFEHHGPVYSLINASLWKLFQLTPGINVILIFRMESLFYLFLTLICIFLIAKKIFTSNLWGLLSVAIISSLAFFQDKGTEIRPDVLQNLFMVAAVYFVLVAIDSKKWYHICLSGLAMGLMFLCNTKAGIAIFAVFIFLIINHFYSRKSFKTTFQDFILFSIPIIFLLLIFCIYFLINNTLNEFLYYVFRFPFMLINGNSTQLPVQYLKFFIKNQPIFLVLSGTGLFLLIKNFVIRRNQPKDDQPLFFLLIFTIIVTSTCLLPLYKQHYLSFLPFLALSAVFCIKEISIFLNRKFHDSKRLHAIEIILIFLIFSGLTIYPVNNMLLTHDEFKFTKQKKFTQYIIDTIDRQQEIQIIWTDAGGYMFNNDFQYYWMSAADSIAVFKAIEGYDVFGKKLIRKMEEEQLRYFIATESEFQYFWPDGYVFEYIKNNFYQHDVFPALWIRH
ncbi:MAG: glycosyltransferase family 39 protein [Spirochaetales bacterium]|nr:glycosyltransferase family 39 protein [Spirochaetales bacterium]